MEQSFENYMQKYTYFNQWKQYIPDITKLDKIMHIIRQKINNGEKVYPQYDDILNFMNQDPDQVKIVLIGQDPYPNYNAIGYSFVIKESNYQNMPKSLQNIIKSIQIDKYKLILYQKKYKLDINSDEMIKLLLADGDQEINQELASHLQNNKNLLQNVTDKISYSDKESPFTKQIIDDINNYQCSSSTMINQVNQGLLLMNTVLTVGEKPKTHKDIGWQEITASILQELTKKKQLIFMLFGCDAQQISKQLKNNQIIIQKQHPSPINTKGCKQFILHGPFLYSFVLQHIGKQFFHQQMLKSKELVNEQDLNTFQCINWWIQ